MNEQTLFSKQRQDHLDATISDLLVISCSSTCFRHLYAHHQEVRLRFTACQATYSTQCTKLATRLSNITTATTGQKTTGSETQSDLLMMGIKTPETYSGTVDY